MLVGVMLCTLAVPLGIVSPGVVYGAEPADENFDSRASQIYGSNTTFGGINYTSTGTLIVDLPGTWNINNTSNVLTSSSNSSGVSVTMQAANGAGAFDMGSLSLYADDNSIVIRGYNGAI
jgi:hypothetical protein